MQDDPAHYIGGDFRGSRLAGADSPNRFVSHYQVAQVSSGYFGQAGAYLPPDNGGGLPGFPLRQGFPHAQDGAQTVPQGGQYLAVDQFIGFPEQLPPLRMTQQYIAGQIPQHRRGNFSGKSPGVGKVHILRAYGYRRAADRLPHGGQGNGRRAEDQLYARGLACALRHRRGQRYPFGQGSVHFPVAGNYRSGHSRPCPWGRIGSFRAGNRARGRTWSACRRGTGPAA